MKMLSVLVFASLMIVALPATVADHGTQSDGTTACETSADAMAVGPIWYLDGPYLYLEDNEMDGLQRGSDASPLSDPIFGPDGVDCSHPDLILF